MVAHRRGNAPRTPVLLHVGLGLCLVLAAGCARADGRGSAFAPSSPSYERSTGCIDTPFAGMDAHSASSGVQCGRQASGLVVQMSGRVLGRDGGLPGAGIEGLWITVHPDGGRGVAGLGAATATAQTGPQGQFIVTVRGAGEQLVVVREGGQTGELLTAQRVDPRDYEVGGELLLYVENVERSAEPSS